GDPAPKNLRGGKRLGQQTPRTGMPVFVEMTTENRENPVHAQQLPCADLVQARSARYSSCKASLGTERGHCFPPACGGVLKILPAARNGRAGAQHFDCADSAERDQPASAYRTEPASKLGPKQPRSGSHLSPGENSPFWRHSLLMQPALLRSG